MNQFIVCMGTKWRVLSIVVRAGLLGGFAWLVLRPHEQAYRGKPLSRWLLEEREASNRGTVSEAEAESGVRALGTNALPTLIRMASTRLSGWRPIVGMLAREQEMAFLHLPRQDEKHQTTAWALKILGPQAEPAVPALIRLLNDRNTEVRRNAAQCLAGIGLTGQAAVPGLIAVLGRSSGTNPDVLNLRREAIRALREMGPAARSAIPQLATFTNDPASPAYLKAEAELALLRIKGESLLPFIERLADTSNTQWRFTAWLVSGLGTNAEPAIPLLVQALSSTNLAIQSAAIRALGGIHGRPDVSIPALIPLLESTNNNVRNESIMALGCFGSAARSAVPQLIHFLNDSNDWPRQCATGALRRIDSEAAKRAGIK